MSFGAGRAEAEDWLAGAGLDEERGRLKLAAERLGQHQSQRRKLGYPVQGRVSPPNIPRHDYRAKNNSRTRRGPPKAPDAAVFIAISRPIVYVTPATRPKQTVLGAFRPSFPSTPLLIPKVGQPSVPLHQQQ